MRLVLFLLLFHNLDFVAIIPASSHGASNACAPMLKYVQHKEGIHKDSFFCARLKHCS